MEWVPVILCIGDTPFDVGISLDPAHACFSKYRTADEPQFDGTLRWTVMDYPKRRLSDFKIRLFICCTRTD